VNKRVMNETSLYVITAWWVDKWSSERLLPVQHCRKTSFINCNRRNDRNSRAYDSTSIYYLPFSNSRR